MLCAIICGDRVSTSRLGMKLTLGTSYKTMHSWRFQIVRLPPGHLPVGLSLHIPSSNLHNQLTMRRVRLLNYSALKVQKGDRTIVSVSLCIPLSSDFNGLGNQVE